MCNNGNHNLRNVFRTPSKKLPGGDITVRWCEDCGAVVVDVDNDGRTYPGAVATMRVPKDARQ